MWKPRSQHGGEYGHELKEGRDSSIAETLDNNLTEFTPLQNRRQRKKNVISTLKKMRSQLEGPQENSNVEKEGNQKDLMTKVKFFQEKF